MNTPTPKDQHADDKAEAQALMNRMKYHIDESGCHYTDEASYKILEAVITQSPPQEVLKAAVEALKFYADQETYQDKLVTLSCDCCTGHDPAPIEGDNGERAQYAIAQLSPYVKGD